MSTEPRRPPPFYCPACGKKHRADLTALQGQSSAVARVSCARCACAMTLRIGDDGLPTCEILGQDPIEATPTSGPAPTAATVDAPPGGDMNKSSTLLALVGAAVVAAVVSFGVGRMAAASPSKGGGGDEGRLAALEKRIEVLQAALDARPAATSSAAVADLQARVESARRSVDEGMSANSAKVAAIERAQGALTGEFETLREDYKALNGRIEANYVNLRSVTKRLQTLENR